MTSVVLLFIAAARLAAAHFSIEYPSWRADTLTNTSYSQWTYPCGGVPAGLPTNNVTDWPITGGSLKLDLHHPWTYVFVNLGIGTNVSNFNYSLTAPFWNETGNGTLCVPTVSLAGILSPVDGQRGSIQVVTAGQSGDALYNCADIVFRANASSLSGSACMNSPGVSYSVVTQKANESTTTTNATSSNSSTASGSSAGVSVGIHKSALTGLTALTLAFTYRLAL